MPEQKCFCSGILLYAVCNMPVLEVRIFINGDAHFYQWRCALSLSTMRTIFGKEIPYL